PAGHRPRAGPGRASRRRPHPRPRPRPVHGLRARGMPRRLRARGLAPGRPPVVLPAHPPRADDAARRRRGPARRHRQRGSALPGVRRGRRRPGGLRMSQGHGRNHGHGHGVEVAALHRGRLALVLAITVAVLLVEVVGAVLSGSLALLADAGHMLTDAAGLSLALLAAVLAARPATESRTWGYRRAEVLAAAAQA